MKQILKSLNPKQIFRRKNSKSLTTSIGSASSSSSDELFRSASPTTALPEWSDHGDTTALRFDFVEAFKMMDLNGDGKITRVELESILRRFAGKLEPPTADEVDAMIGEIDIDGDGCISLNELETVGSVFESTVSGEDELREAFEVFDADHDGKITAEELHAVLGALGDDRCTLADCRRMIAGVDKNGDGFVCFEDFTRMMDLAR